MKIEDILALEDFEKVVSLLCIDTYSQEMMMIDSSYSRDIDDYIKEYNGERQRRSTSVGKRENKSVDIYSDTETNSDGSPKKTGSKTVFVAKVKTNLPKKIVRIAKAFVFGGEMNVELSDQNDAGQRFKEIAEDDLKLKYVFNELAENCMVETKSAIIFYPQTKEVDGKNVMRIRSLVLSNKTSQFYPHFDDYGDMDAFIRKYKDVDIEGKIREYLWIQTANLEYRKVKNDNGWEDIVPPQQNLAKKITVVYVEQPLPEWENIATSMDYYEQRISRLVDTNDYFGDPILKTYGDTRLPTKDTVGKTIEFDMSVDPDSGKAIHGDADYLAWQQSVDSVKLELETHRYEVHSGTSTPDIAFDNLKSLGNITGVGMKMMFLDAFIKASEKKDKIFNAAVQRSISIIVALMSNVSDVKYKNALNDLRIKIKFRSILPEDLKEYFDVLKAANGDKPINSQETITALSPFTSDVQNELTTMEKEAQTESSRQSLIGSVVPPVN